MKAYFITSDTLIRNIRLIADDTAEIFKIKSCGVGNLLKYSLHFCLNTDKDIVYNRMSLVGSTFQTVITIA